MKLMPAFLAVCMLSTASVLSQEIEASLAETREQACLELVQAMESPTTDKKQLASELKKSKAKHLQWADEHPDITLIRYVAGLACIFDEQPVEALPHYKAAYEASGRNATIGMHYSLALQIAKQPINALAIARQIATDNPQVIQLQMLAATHLIGVQKYREAQAILSKYLGTDIPKPNQGYATILQSLGVCQLYLEKTGEAVSTLEQAVGYFPGAVRILTSLAEAQLKSGETTEAIKNLNAALKINRNSTATLYWMGVAQQQKGDPDAMSFFRRARVAGEKDLKINSDNGKDHYLLYQICVKLEASKDAAKYKKQAADLHFTFEAPWAAGVKH